VGEMKKRLFILGSMLLLFIPGDAQVDYFSPQYIYEFAENLYKEKDYLRAANEYQRYLFLMEGSIDQAPILFKIGKCYNLSNQQEKAISYFKRIIEENPQSNYREEAYYQIAYAYFKMGQYKQSINYINENKNYLQSEKFNRKLTNLLGINYLYLKEWERAYNLFSSNLTDKKDTSHSLRRELKQIAAQGMQLPYKSMVLAATISSLIPGAGKIYAGRFYDGLFSLIIIGLTTWQAYEGFSKERPVKGWVYGTLGTLFYLGNIYGSAVAVKIYNEKIEKDLLNKVNLLIKNKEQ
jgi:tetratricopeptide (TPR) repeat protein